MSIPDQGTTLIRIVIGVDPPSGDGTCGIIACALDEAGKAHVLADHSLTAITPETWARAVADAARIWSSPRRGEGDHQPPADGGGAAPSGAIRTTTAWRQAHAPRPVAHPIPVLVVAEVNQGGRMVESILRAADPEMHVRRVTATVGKAHRAEPIARLFEAGQVVLHGRFPELEAELLGMIAGGRYEGPSSGGRGAPVGSPDRADAMVWALTELMVKGRAGPRVRGFSG